MGKKKVIKQTQEEALRETEAIEKKMVKAVGGSARRFDKGRVYISASYNNTIVTVTDEKGNVVSWASAGSLGFHGPKKATPYAASKTVETLMEKVKKAGLHDVDVFVKGVGSGRESAVRAFAANGLNIFSIKDVTPVPHNGCRPRKVRRV